MLWQSSRQSLLHWLFQSLHSGSVVFVQSISQSRQSHTESQCAYSDKLVIYLKGLLTMLGLFSLSTVQIRFIKMEMQIHDHQGSLNKEVS